jgi:hypothetical protein
MVIVMLKYVQEVVVKTMKKAVCKPLCIVFLTILEDEDYIAEDESDVAEEFDEEYQSSGSDEEAGNDQGS